MRRVVFLSLVVLIVCGCTQFRSDHGYYEVHEFVRGGEREDLSQWELVWEDDLDEFDPDRWEIATHTFRNNLVQFVKENVTFEEGIMKLHLTNKRAKERRYSGAEYRTKEQFLYGKFVVRMKAAVVGGGVSSFFIYLVPIRLCRRPES